MPTDGKIPKVYVFRPSATVSRNGLMESRVHRRRRRGGPPPPARPPPGWTPPLRDGWLRRSASTLTKRLVLLSTHVKLNSSVFAAGAVRGGELCGVLHSPFDVRVHPGSSVPHGAVSGQRVHVLCQVRQHGRLREAAVSADPREIPAEPCLHCKCNRREMPLSAGCSPCVCVCVCALSVGCQWGTQNRTEVNLNLVMGTKKHPAGVKAHQPCSDMRFTPARATLSRNATFLKPILILKGKHSNWFFFCAILTR